MTVRRKQASAIAAILALAAAGLALMASADPAEQDLTVIARDMAFYLPHGEEANPTLEIAAGTAIRLTFINRDSGIDHDLQLETLGVEMAPLRGDGSAASVRFRAPREPGEHEYVCELHGKMMRGSLVVR